MSDQSCENCFYWREQECRKNAPVPVYGSAIRATNFPVTKPDHWCGEWRPARD